MSFIPQEFQIFELKNNHGIAVQILNFGATIFGIQTPDRSGRSCEITKGFRKKEFYEHNAAAYLGANMGRFANRIANAEFPWEGKKVSITKNFLGHCLHGGTKNFSLVFWEVSDQNSASISLRYRSPEGEEGFPGSLETRITYSLNDSGELQICWEAESDAPTPVNFTNHAYFNLAGEETPDLRGHQIKIDADFYLPAAEDQLPSGEISKVQGTVFDFTEFRSIEERLKLAEEDSELKAAVGYDHGFPLRGSKGQKVRAAELIHAETGRKLEIDTDALCLHFYTANFLSPGPYDRTEGNQKHSAVCFEAQGYPNFPNIRQFPSQIVTPGSIYRQETVYRFLTI